MSLALRWLVALCVPPLLLWLTLALLATPAFLRWEYARIPSPAGLEASDRQALAETTTRYVLGHASRAEVAALRDAGAPLYAAEELAHLDDVRLLIGRVRALGLWAGLVLLAVVLVPPLRRRADLPRALELGGWLCVGLVGLAAVGLAIGWSWLFKTFHELLFPPGTWRFSLESGLIRLFPDRFWFESALALGTLFLVEGIGLALISRRWRRGRSA